MSLILLYSPGGVINKIQTGRLRLRTEIQPFAQPRPQGAFPPPKPGKIKAPWGRGCTLLLMKGTPFVYLLLAYGRLVHIPSLELCVLFNCCKCSIFEKYESITLNQNVFSTLFFTAMHLLDLLGFSADQNDKFSYPFIYLNWWNPYSFIYLNPKKGTPFDRSLFGPV